MDGLGGGAYKLSPRRYARQRQQTLPGSDAMRRLIASTGRLIIAALFSLTVYVWPAAAQGPIVFEGARLIVGDGRAPIDDSTFIIEGSRFTQIGRKGQVPVPAGATRVDLSGKTVMPAIVDAHGHPGFLDAVTGKMSKANFTRENYIDHLQRYAYHGVAAVLSTGTDMGDLAYQLRAEVIPNAALIRTVGLGLAYPGSGPADASRNDVPSAVTSPAEARKAVQELARHKADFVKIWVDTRNGTRTKLSPEMFSAAADEATRLGMRSIAHVFDLADAKLLVKAGVEGFLHSIRDQEVDDEFIKLAKERNVWFTPNLGGINRPSLMRENGTPAWFDEPLVRETISPALIRERAEMYASRKRSNTPLSTVGRVYDIVNTRKLHAAGVREVLGGDSAGDERRWLGLHGLLEFENMVAAGFTPMEMIVAATRDSANVLGLEQLGMVAPGKSADFIVLAANPLDNIANVRKIDNVYLRGQEVDRAGLRARWQGQWRDKGQL
jgi:imidazolonepropionase-like amidohydrolase